ncbi:MAG: hypothetical protein KA715_12925 [Xanthomonadaceae bacterium]|nr:hypothetical protein [Xanthomonadaceae bacterium]
MKKIILCVLLLISNAAFAQIEFVETYTIVSQKPDDIFSTIINLTDNTGKVFCITCQNPFDASFKRSVAFWAYGNGSDKWIATTSETFNSDTCQKQIYSLLERLDGTNSIEITVKNKILVKMDLKH